MTIWLRYRLRVREYRTNPNACPCHTCNNLGPFRLEDWFDVCGPYLKGIYASAREAIDSCRDMDEFVVSQPFGPLGNGHGSPPYYPLAPGHIAPIDVIEGEGSKRHPCVLVRFGTDGHRAALGLTSPPTESNQFSLP